MLSIKVNSSSLDLSPDFAVTMNFKSPLFNEQGTFSYPFKVPSTHRNIAILGFPARIENLSNPYKEFTCEVFFNEIILFTGLLKLKVSNSGYMEGQIYEGRGNFVYATKYKTLQNIDFGHKHFAQMYMAEEWMQDTNALDYPDRPCAFPMLFNDQYLDDYSSYSSDLYKYFNPQSGNSLYIDNNGINNYFNIPFLYFRYVIDTLFEKLGYKFNDEFFTRTTDWNKLLLYNSVNANEATIGQFFNTSILLFDWNYHVPRVKITDFIKGYEDFFGLRHFVNDTKKEILLVSLDDIIKQPYAIDLSSKVDQLSVELDDRIKGYLLQMELDETDPIYDPYKAGAQRYFDLIKEPVATTNDLPAYPCAVDGEVRYIDDLNLFAQFSLSQNTWQIIQNDYLENINWKILLRYNDKQISSSFSVMLGDSGAQPVKCLNKREDWEKIKPRFCFKRKEDWGGGFGSTTFGSTSLDAISLLYGSPVGIFKKQYSDFLKWTMNTKNVKIIKRFDFVELREFDFSKKYSINGNRYLLKDLQVTLRMNGIQPATMNGLVCF